ncbi:MAG: leucyl aminopeptidase [Thermogemmatispora sp.]|uniref:leucyl aminopeptidase n=1 Tax=Thermogemmatispora sp. TaxID=1968838 RepID=UPI0019E3F2EC|nr:leucyl aminopeptidase [Thermogemmatispora sp.]MBE3565543.1 leucyl aminopeptidase [Thermogemmatispora sp.]
METVELDLRLTNESVTEIACDALVVSAGRPRGSEQARLSAPGQLVDARLEGLLLESCTRGEIKGYSGEITTFYAPGKLAARRVIVLGLGDLERDATRTLRRACATLARQLQEKGARRVVLAIDVTSLQPAPGSPQALTTLAALQAQVEGFLLGLYRFSRYRSDGGREYESAIRELLLQVGLAQRAYDSSTLEAALQRGRILAEATNFARDLVNEPPNILTPGELARRARSMAETWGLAYEVLERPQMEELGMGGLLAVSRGSSEPPYLAILRYRGAPEQAGGLALVGKGITFDSGGLSLKSADGMATMKGDMAGAAAVLGAIQAIARLKPALNVTALVPTSENMPDGHSYRPGDILRIMNGKTIEIVNTDAEGRLILADAMSYAAREGLTPIIDVATLTGGIVVALGHVYTGLFSNDTRLSEELIAAGEAVGEKLWRLPLDDEYGEQIKSEVADIKQTGGRPASSITAAKVLEHFAGSAAWAHLDIAGTSFVDSPKPYQEKGATGVAVRTLAEFIMRRAAAQS